MVNLNLEKMFKPAYAQITNPAIGEAGSGEGAQILSRLISIILSALLIMGVIFFMTNFILGAYRWISGGHDKSYIQEARDRVSHAIIGLVILFSVFAIIRLIGDIFGLNLMKLSIPTISDVGGI
ncbi:MAG TPA: hypothetical protein VMW41_00810 [Candidatus Bathyarchaeia archaeon]|nr:hypothetical protein [Candidatus Bathyarchaeia archaeon]